MTKANPGSLIRFEWKGGSSTVCRALLGPYWLALAILTHWPQLDLPVQSIGVWEFDKAFHVAGFAILNLLLIRADLFGRPVATRLNAVVATFVAMAYVVVDELAQAWTARSVSVSDLVAGQIGVLSIFLILTAKYSQWINWFRLVAITLSIGMGLVFVVGALVPIEILDLLDPAGSSEQWPHVLAHLLPASVLTLLLAAAAPAGLGRPRLGAMITIGVMGLAAPMMETAQALMGQVLEPVDVYAHQVGLLAALILWALLVVGSSVRSSEV